VTVKRLRIIVKGVVQGVGYRYYAVDVARRLALDGYVKNLPDGTVEVDVQGDEGMLEEFLESLRVGPRAAHVTGLDVEELEPTDRFDGFGVKF